MKGVSFSLINVTYLRGTTIIVKISFRIITITTIRISKAVDVFILIG